MRLWVTIVSFALFASCSAAAQQNADLNSDERLFVLARTDLRGFAQELTANEPSELGKVAAIVHWLVHHFDWKETDYKQRTLPEIVERRGGNCNDFAMVAIAAMKELGIHPRRVHDVHIRTESPERGERARAKVKDTGNYGYSIFGRHHNDHVWLEVFDSHTQEWFPVDPWSGVVGLDEWIKARVWFGPRTSINPDASDMIVPFAIFAADSDGNFTVNRTQHYLVDGFDRFYGGKLHELPAWKQWTVLLAVLDKKVKGAFAGTTNLLDSEAPIDSVAKTYEELRSEYKGPQPK